MRFVLATLVAVLSFPLPRLLGDDGNRSMIRALALPGEEWRWITFNSQFGVPPGRVNVIEQDGDGVIWVGTEKGLAWYNGYEFLPVDTGVPKASVADIRGITRRLDGDVVIRAGDQLWIGRKGTLRRLPTPWPVLDFALVNDDLVYCIAASGHFLNRDGSWFPVEHSNSADRLFQGKDGASFLVSPPLGLLRWEGSRWSSSALLPRVRLIDAVAESSDVIALSARTPDEWVGFWELPRKGHGMPKRITSDMARVITLSSSSEGIALLDSGDVRVRTDGSWKSLGNTFNATRLRQGSSVFLHPNGDIWLGANGAVDIFRAHRTALRGMVFPPGDGRNNVHDILRRRNGDLWLATSDGLVIREQYGRWRSIRTAAGQTLGIVTAVNEDPAGDVWIASGSSFGGAFRFANGVWRKYGSEDGLSHWPVHRIKKDLAGQLWFLTNAAAGRGQPEESGAFHWNGEKFQFWGRPQGMPESAVISFSQAPDGALWFGTARGILRFAGGSWERYQTPHGRGSSRIFDISVAPDGTAWFCLQRGLGGVGKMIRQPGAAPVFTYFTKDDGLPSDEVWSVTTEKDGRVWAATANGIGTFRGGPWVALGSGYGIEGVKTWGFLPEEKDLWIGALGQGLFHVERAERLGADPLLLFSPPVLEDDRWKIRWRALTRGGMIGSSDILTRFRVDGGAWSPWSVVRDYSFPASQPGPHRIEAQAVGALGDISALPASYAFSVPYPFYRRLDFLLLAGFLSLCALAAAVQIIRSRFRYTRELQEAKLKAEESGKARSAFLAMMSHEIRTPMNGVLGLTSLMLDSPLDHRQRTYMEAIRSSAGALLTLINDVLDFSKIESGKFQITPAPFDLEDLCDQVLSILAVPAQEKSLVLAVDYSPSVPRVLIGDEGRVRQILFNLAGNAVKFTESGWVRITIDAPSSHGETLRLRLTVEDTGIGIAQTDIINLFKEFNQVDSSAVRRHGGTGLGLAISRKLANFMGGSISVESRLGQGSRFICELPFAPAPQSAADAPPDLRGRALIIHPSDFVRTTLSQFCRGVGLHSIAVADLSEVLDFDCPYVFLATASYVNVRTKTRNSAAALIRIDDRISSSALSLVPLSRRRLQTVLQHIAGHAISPPVSSLGADEIQFSAQVLVVEDNRTNQLVIRRLLETWGCAVDVAADGAQALAKCTDRSYDLILMDVQMPVMDGLEAARRLRDFSSPHIAVPVIALTANVQDEDRRNCLQAGMTDYLPKPIVKADLLEILRRYLPVRQHRRLANS